MGNRILIVIKRPNIKFQLEIRPLGSRILYLHSKQC